MGNIIISYDKSNLDMPVLIVATENASLFSYSPTFNVIKTFTGVEATELYNKLTKKEG